MQFQVPQFIDVEDKIFGPLTSKQFFYLLGGGALILLFYFFFETWLMLILGIPVGAFAAALAFLKINGIPFVRVLNNAIAYAFSNRLYLWKKKKIAPSSSTLSVGGASPKTLSVIPDGAAPKLTQNKLQDLAWSLDIQQQRSRHG